MNKAMTPLKLRAALTALAAILILTAFGAGSASATSIKLRIETPSATVFNGTVNTGPRSVPTVSGNCTGTTSTVAISKPTAITAIYDWADSVGASAPALSTAYGGTYLCQVGSNVEAYPDGSWFLKINNVDSPPDPGYVTYGDQLHDGDSVLAYYSGGNPDSSLDLRMPTTANPGVAVTGFVDQYSNFSGDVKSNGTGVKISGGGASTTTASDGSFSLTFPTTGTFLISATKSGSVRGSAWVTVDPAATVAPVIPSPTVLQLRIAARRQCLRNYKWHRTSSPRYKKCVAKANKIGKSK